MFIYQQADGNDSDKKTSKTVIKTIIKAIKLKTTKTTTTDKKYNNNDDNQKYIFVGIFLDLVKFLV